MEGLIFLIIFWVGFILWIISKKEKEHQQAEEDQKRREEDQRQELEKKKNSQEMLKSWKPLPWKDRTKTIYKSSVEIWGSYDAIDKQWNKQPMTLKFVFNKLEYSISVDYDKIMSTLNNNEKWGITLNLRDHDVFNLYYYDREWYYACADIGIDDSIALINATRKREQDKLRSEIERAKNLADNEAQIKQSRHIPEKEKIIVWNRDGGKCVQCGSQNKLEFDHVIPMAKGGSNTARNIQLLCEECNRRKSDKIG